MDHTFFYLSKKDVLFKDNSSVLRIICLISFCLIQIQYLYGYAQELDIFKNICMIVGEKKEIFVLFPMHEYAFSAQLLFVFKLEAFYFTGYLYTIMIFISSHLMLGIICVLQTQEMNQ